jgi:tetratricopeptide (TPR) repeat protein
VSAASVRRLALIGALLALSGCSDLFKKDSERTITAGDERAAAGDYRIAIKLYEASLDGTPRTAEVHQKLAMIYDEKLHDPLSALHHFNRYLDLAPEGPHAAEARAFQKRGPAKLEEVFNRAGLITQDEAVRLKKENLDLRMNIVQMKSVRPAAGAASGAAKGEPAPKPVPAGARTYVVQRGDTYATIAAKFYKNKARWPEIRDANFENAVGTPKIRAGQTLVIP